LDLADHDAELDADRVDVEGGVALRVALDRDPARVHEEAGEAAFGTPIPRPEPEWIAIVAIEDVFLHGEDKASAIVVLDEPTALGARSFVRYHVRFAKEAERWLIDAVMLGPTQ
ncbi:MAG: hypothetical protein C4346_13695, partial [Chloroflexota bacterium]